MKKNRRSLLLLILSMFVLVACGKQDVVMEFSEFQVMRNFGDLNDEAIEAIKSEEGIKDAKKNEDGSLSITMGGKEHEALMKDMDEELASIIEYTETASEFKFIDRIELNRDQSKMDIYVDKGQLEVYKSKNKEGGEDILEALSLTLGSVVSSYKAYDGSGEKVEINYLDKDSEDIIKKIDFPEFFENIIEDMENGEGEDIKEEDK